MILRWGWAMENEIKVRVNRVEHPDALAIDILVTGGDAVARAQVHTKIMEIVKNALPKGSVT